MPIMYSYIYNYECTKLYTYIQWLHYGLHHKVGQSYVDVRNTWKKQPKEIIKMNESSPVLKKIHLAQTLSQWHCSVMPLMVTCHELLIVDTNVTELLIHIVTMSVLGQVFL